VAGTRYSVDRYSYILLIAKEGCEDDQ